jgi:hypothetical protein
VLVCAIGFAQPAVDADSLKNRFARLERFMHNYHEAVQFRELGGDSLSVRLMNEYQTMFLPGCLHPDLLNPIISRKGEPLLAGARYRKLDEYLAQVKENYPSGLFVRVRALNADLNQMAQQRATIIMERKTWGDVKGRWRLEVVDTLKMMIIADPMGQFKIDKLDLVGYGYLLTDVKKISGRTVRSVREPDLKALKRSWERKNIPRKKSTRENLLIETQTIADSVAVEIPCTGARRAWTSSEVQQAFTTFSLYINPARLHSPLVAFSDRNGNATSESPDVQGALFRDLGFLQPLYIIDIRGEYVHVVEYIYAGADPNTGEIRRCLEDYGWINQSRLIFGTDAMRDPNNGRPLAVAGAADLAATENSERKYYEAPDRSRERESTLKEAPVLYIIKQSGDAVLVGNKLAASVYEFDRTVLGWIRLKDITLELQTP